jgi:hypothetical protein
MLSEAIIIGIVVLLLCVAISFYIYVRLSFLEKKVSVMESILVDVRVALDSIMSEHMHHPPPAPIAFTPGVELSTPAPLESSESETVPEENFYSSVLEQAHDKVPESGVTADTALESFDDEKAGSTDTTNITVTTNVPTSSVGPNIDAMTRQELVSLAESKGLRVKRSLNRAEVLALLRRSNPTQNDSVSTGTENVSGSTGNTLQAGASLDGSVSVDLDQNGASLETTL